jgi:hypothetical protein
MMWCCRLGIRAVTQPQGITRYWRHNSNSGNSTINISSNSNSMMVEIRAAPQWVLWIRNNNYVSPSGCSHVVVVAHSLFRPHPC